jgi:hypothetical protein
VMRRRTEEEEGPPVLEPPAWMARAKWKRCECGCGAWMVKFGEEQEEKERGNASGT